MSKYKDIIDLPHHISKTHPQMSMNQRAAQFAPFAALTGHGEAINETARFVDKKIELSEYERSILDEHFQSILKVIAEKPIVNIIYFIPNQNEEEGNYVSIIARINKWDDATCTITLENGVVIEKSAIISIELQDK